MKIAVIGFTGSGCAYAEKIKQGLEAGGAHTCTAYGKWKGASGSGVTEVTGSLKAWTESVFAACDGLIFVGATGIAVRSIAPFVKSKTTDPAVLVMDEQGTYVISLLSGHMGGANRLTEEVAAICGAIPVITTATDRNGKFSVDTFAKEQGMHISSMQLAKEVSAAVLAGTRIPLRTEFPVRGEMPGELFLINREEEEADLEICITKEKKEPQRKRTLYLNPRVLVLGMGCKRGTKMENIEGLIRKVFQEQGLSMDSIGAIGSIDLKKEETGILELAEKLQVPFLTYTGEELEAVEYAEGFSESAFVQQIAGVGNVCERAALKAAGAERLLVKKTAEQGVTLAVAERNFEICF